MTFRDFVARTHSGGAKVATDPRFSNMPVAGAIAQPPLVVPSVLPRPSNSMVPSAALSLTLTNNGGGRGLGGQGLLDSGGVGFDGSVAASNELEAARTKEEEYESRSGSENMDGGSGDEQEGENPRKKKRYHRHTPQQIQELEGLFKECPHPDEKQRLELSKRLNLESRQVKFWFQNRRTQMKTQLERHENSILRQENDKLRVENMSIRDAMRNPICSNCGGPATLGEVSLEEQHLRMDNARLKDELERVCALASKFFGRPVSALNSPILHSVSPCSSLELAVRGNGLGGFGGDTMPMPLPAGNEFGGGGGALVAMQLRPTSTMTTERSMLAELALLAMDELMKMANSDQPLWIPAPENGRETLNYEEYLRSFPRCIGQKLAGFVTEATRESGMAIINSVAIVETLMDSNRWVEMFPSVVARSSTTDVISGGVGGTRNGSLQLMQAELQVLSPLVPIREVRFLRFCKQHAEGVWAVVDVSVDSIGEGQASLQRCRRLPSGCVVQDMPNGYSKVVWVEHAEYDESSVHQLHRPLLRSGLGFGSHRWVASLQRQCECLAMLMSSSSAGHDPATITAAGRRSMLKLAQRMTNNFCAGVCASTVHQWNKLSSSGSMGENVRVMTRKSVDDPGEPPGVVLSAATSVWMPVAPRRIFDFLRDDGLRREWDILSNGGPMQEMAHIAKGQDGGNCVSLLRASAMNANQSSMLILQETCTDASGSLVVYAPVDIPAMHVVMNGGDSAYVALLPSGFAILPDSQVGSGRPDSPVGSASGETGGSLLTVAFQILVNSLPNAKLTVESVETVNNLISCTVQKIKAALQLRELTLSATSQNDFNCKENKCLKDLSYHCR